MSCSTPYTVSQDDIDNQQMLTLRTYSYYQTYAGSQRGSWSSLVEVQVVQRAQFAVDIVAVGCRQTQSDPCEPTTPS